MALSRRASPLVFALLLAFCLVPGLSIIAIFSWLKQQPEGLVYLITGIAGTVTILGSLALGIVHDRGMDEWQKSNSRFASFWGEAVGTALVALLLNLPAGRDGIVSVVGNWAGVPAPDTKVVILAFVFGFMAVVLTRMVCMALFAVGWALWKSRAPREA